MIERKNLIHLSRIVAPLGLRRVAYSIAIFLQCSAIFPQFFTIEFNPPDRNPPPPCPCSPISRSPMQAYSTFQLDSCVHGLGRITVHGSMSTTHPHLPGGTEASGPFQCAWAFLGGEEGGRGKQRLLGHLPLCFVVIGTH